MLNGIAPILIFNFKKLTPSAEASIAKIPVISSIVNAIGLPPIPIYLDEKLTGLFIDSEDKNIDIETTVETLPNGGPPQTKQKAINSTIKINIEAKKDSIGLTLLSALCDLVVPKVTSQEYSITYLHGGITVFGGLMHSFSVAQSANTDKMMVTLEITKTTTLTDVKPPIPQVAATGEAVSLDGGGSLGPTAPTSPPLTGPPPTPVQPSPIPIGGLN